MEPDIADFSVESEVRRLTGLLDQLVRQAKRSRRSLEADLELGSAGLSKILRGTIRLQVSHVLRVLEALQVDPYDFFRAAYDKRRLKQSPLIEQLRQRDKAQQETKPPQEEPPAVDELPEFERRVRQALLKLLSENPTETS